MRFIDLFAGLGGFHIALERLGHECVLASEIAPELKKLYKTNFGIEPIGDIRKIDVKDIPDHDILCGGFPCQPFSKAGAQKGFEDKISGDLFQVVLDIIEEKKPAYFILENVPNIMTHDEGKTWKHIIEKLGVEELGYKVTFRRFSPHQFGIPQVRGRVFIVGSRVPDGLGYFERIQPVTNVVPDLRLSLELHPAEARALPKHYIECFEVWQEFIDELVKREPLPSFPIWSTEFGATYPYKGTTPHSSATSLLSSVKGSHGLVLSGFSKEEQLSFLPSYARRNDEKFPPWKEAYITQNRALYKRNAEWLDEWIPKIKPYASSLQKLEWNFKEGEPNIWKHIIQVRASGIRVKRANATPSLIAMTTTQVPIVAWEKRFMTVRECMKLQCMDGLKHMPPTESAAFKALGNAVNADLVTILAAGLLDQQIPDESIAEGTSYQINDTAPSITEHSAVEQLELF